MNFRKLIYPLLLVSGLMSSCEKDELTLPTTVIFEFSMNVNEEDGKFLQFDQGELSFNALEFDGDREAGQDIFFLSEFEDSVEVDLDLEVASENVSYDVPQGVYKRIKLRIGSNSLTAGPRINYGGIYNSARNGDIEVRIEFSGDEPIEMNAVGPSANNEIVLNKNMPTTAEIHFDPLILFQFANSRQLESADVIIIEGNPVIIISKDANITIFNQIVSRLERSITATFN